MRTKRTWVALLFLLAAASLAADVVTLPAAASIQGGNPFFSDVRVFNTSYASSVDVTATYRCFIATISCPTLAPRIDFTLAPRESRPFNDIVAVAFGAHDTAGGVEFEFSGPEDQIVVTSRLFSTSPLNSVGMFIPGLDESRANALSVLTSIRHDPLNGIIVGFRTNVGVFNPGDFPVDVTFTIFNGGVQVGATVTRSVPLHSGVQVSGIFEAAGQGEISTANATIVVSASAPVFSYAAVLDNRTADPIFVVGAADQSSQAATPTPTLPGPTATRTHTPVGGMTPTATRTLTLTPTPPGPTATLTLTPSPTQPGPTRTFTPTIEPTPSNTPSITPTNHTPTNTATFTRTPTFTITPTPTNLPNQVNIGAGGLHAFTPSTITINAGDTVHWVWMGSPHSTTSGSCVGTTCTADGNWTSPIQGPPATFQHNFPSAGTFTYFCQVHKSLMQGTVIVNP